MFLKLDEVHKSQSMWKSMVIQLAVYSKGNCPRIGGPLLLQGVAVNVMNVRHKLKDSTSK